jgi:hypothetical protein
MENQARSAVLAYRQSADRSTRLPVLPENSCTQLAHRVVPQCSFPGRTGNVLSHFPQARFGPTSDIRDVRMGRLGLCRYRTVVASRIGTLD